MTLTHRPSAALKPRPVSILVRTLLRQWRNGLRSSLGLPKLPLSIVLVPLLLTALVWNLLTYRLTQMALSSALTSATSPRLSASALINASFGAGVTLSAAAVVLLFAVPDSGPLRVVVTLSGRTSWFLQVVLDQFVMLGSVLAGLSLGLGGVLLGVLRTSNSLDSWAGISGLLLFWLVGALVTVTGWRAGESLAAAVFGTRPAIVQVVASLAAITPLGLLLADLALSSFAGRPMWSVSWSGDASAEVRSPWILLHVVSEAVAVLALYIVITGRERGFDSSVGHAGLAACTGSSVRVLKSDFASMYRLEYRTALRHPVMVSNVLLYLVLIAVMAALPYQIRVLVGGLFAIVLCSLVGMLSVTNYGRSRSYQWLTVVSTGRPHSWVGPQVAWAATQGVLLAALSPLLILRDMSPVDALPPLAAATFVSVAVGWMSGVVIPYSDAAPGLTWLATGVTLIVVGGAFFLAEKYNVFESGALVLLGSAGVIALALGVGLLFVRRRWARAQWSR